MEDGYTSGAVLYGRNDRISEFVRRLENSVHETFRELSSARGPQGSRVGLDLMKCFFRFRSSIELLCILLYLLFTYWFLLLYKTVISLFYKRNSEAQ